MNSDVPKIVRELYLSYYSVYDQPKLGSGGFMRIRWLEKKAAGWILKTPAEHPDYSKEQYTPEFMGEHGYFYYAFEERLGYKPLSG